jgi:hypothetical protein
MKEKQLYYFKRTMEHIHRVHNNMLNLVTNYHKELELDFADGCHLMNTVLNHDRSKFSFTQAYPYVELTEFHRQRKLLGNKDYEYPDPSWKKTIDNAIQDHYYNENHHPEKHGGHVTGFTKLEMIEVMCDLQAMAQEFNEGSCRGFYENVWTKKHNMKDTEMHQKIAEICMQCFEKDLAEKE